MSEQVKGWLLRAKDAPSGVEFEEFFAAKYDSYCGMYKPVEIQQRIAAHQAAYPDVPLYLVEATKITK